MFEDDKSYFERRAKFETERAKNATVPEVAQVHRLLAKAYYDKLTTTGSVANKA